MKLSVIIVNYNVRYFVEQALQSIFRSHADFDYEVFVVDNHSVDGSVEMIRQRFPQVRLIANDENLGFSKANNLGIRQSAGEYVLLLNPDTIVQEDSLQKMVDFLDAHPDAGGVGVKMMDGKGHFLPESKRGFPTPFVAFCKMSGLSRLFPKSKRFNYYHLGHLDREETHPVDVLSGACMALRRSVLDKTGLLDEDYFMYGEDIDLSYRIIRADYKNYYFPGTEIIHFKGESTKKGSVNYVRMFYRAMIIFTRKHLEGPSARYMAGLLQLAIYGRALAALAGRVSRKIAWPVVDAASIYASMIGIKALWENVIKEGIVYPSTYLAVNVPAYIVIWLLAFFFSGGYDKPVRLPKIPYGIGIGTVIVLALYALLPESLRTSRGMILTGALSAVIVMVFWRLVYYAVKGDLDQLSGRNKRILVVAGEAEGRRVGELLSKTGLGHEILGLAHNGAPHNSGNGSKFLGRIEDVPEMARVLKADEIIFSMKDASNAQVMQTMSALGGGIDYKIISGHSEVILGSHSRHHSGELYTVDIRFHLNQPGPRRLKRVFDVLVSFFMLLLSPVAFLAVKNKRGFFGNMLNVMIGRKTLVGYAGNDHFGLPDLPPGVVEAADARIDGSDSLRQANVAYARDWTVWTDVLALRKL